MKQSNTSETQQEKKMKEKKQQKETYIGFKYSYYRT